MPPTVQLQMPELLVLTHARTSQRQALIEE